MKIIIALLTTASLMACGGKKPAPSTTPASTDTTPTTTPAADGTGGTTYGGAQTTPSPAGTEPAAGGQ